MEKQLRGRGLVYNGTVCDFMARYVPAVLKDEERWELATLDGVEDVWVEKFDTYPQLLQAMAKIAPLGAWLPRHWDYPDRPVPRIYVYRE